LNSKIFTFDKKLTGQDLTKMSEESKNLDVVIKGLSCMRGIKDDFVPSFKFFQFKKALIRDRSTNQEQIMLCFSDISQKILYDTSKAEGELLSLINSTISHEMRNPLNSIIN
jgi:signal transduction histidine kinase